jgi:hypothetical protein
MLIREKMDDGGTEGGSASDAVLECLALPPPHSCLTANAEWIGFFGYVFWGMSALYCAFDLIVCIPVCSSRLNWMIFSQ